MRAFVVRSFGTKSGVDFERVHNELIAPALQASALDGGTTATFVEAGNIREDMFRELVLADLVIADVSIHNANVFYELGIRHAVKNRATVLLRARIDEVPFDLKTERYLTYDPQQPGAALSQLVGVLRDTLNSERSDSPVFQLLPGFTAGPHATLLDIPRDLAEEIGQAVEAGRIAHLRLIADEVVGLRFEEVALRCAARALKELGDDAGAKPAWEKIRATRPDDLEANRALSDIYRRLDDLVQSDQAIERALRGRPNDREVRAELLALKGSNSKRRWIKQWQQGIADLDLRARTALLSSELAAALRLYRRGFEEDLNHFYSGLNSLALTTITLALAERYPQDWQAKFDSDLQAQAAHDELELHVERLASAVRASIESARDRADRSGSMDYWLDIGAADLRFLTSDEPARVTAAYEQSVHSAIGSAALGSVRDQLQLFVDLGVRADNATPTLEILAGRTQTAPTDAVRPLVFTGHMIDSPGRNPPRFPPKDERTAATAIRGEVEKLADDARRRNEGLLGIAGASDGGDLLFLEACYRLDIPTMVLLPVPELIYRATALTRQASQWASRYHDARRHARQVLTLATTRSLPAWLQTKPGYSTWERNNRWLLHHAWATTGSDRVTVLALWDGQATDSKGGVAGMVAAAAPTGAEVFVLNTATIFNLEPTPPAPGTPASIATAALPPASSTLTDHNVPPAGDAPAAAPNPAADPVLQHVWKRQRQWSLTAAQSRTHLDRWRTWNLLLLVTAAVLGALAVGAPMPAAAKAAASVAAAVALALAGVVQTTALNAQQMSRWTDSRNASEALKTEIYRYLAGVAPYETAERNDLLQKKLDAIQARVAHVSRDAPLAAPDKKPPPQIEGFAGYVTGRAQDQADWHRKNSDEHRRQYRSLSFWQLAATVIGAVLAAVGAALPALQLGAWTAAVTTIAASIGTHLAAAQHQKIAASYAATADELDRLIHLAGTADTPERRTRFVDDVERTITAQNTTWSDLLSAK